MCSETYKGYTFIELEFKNVLKYAGTFFFDR